MKDMSVNKRIAVNKHMRLSLILLTVCLIMLSNEGCYFESSAIPGETEIVLKKGDKIKAENNFGTITIEAGEGLRRFYSWEGATRSVVMIPRSKRWNGSLGLYFPGDGNHWQEHERVTRGVLEEGQQHFETLELALNWLNKFTDIVYRDDGLAVRYSKSIKPQPGPGSTIFVSVWQIYVGGKKPDKIPGSSNKSIIVEKIKK